VFSDGRLELRIQEGLTASAADPHGLFDRAVPMPVVGRTVGRPAAEDALLLTVADLAQEGLFGPLLLYVDLRELLRDAALGDEGALARLRSRAEAAGLSRALHGAATLVAHFFPETAARARALTPELGVAERAAVLAIVEQARDPARLRHLRGAEAAARRVVAP
jgi:hypothetical protein